MFAIQAPAYIGTGNINIFKENSLDIVFSISVLNHFQLETIIHWVSKALKPGGLFVLDEPSAGNLFARIGRRLITNRSGFFYISDKHLHQVLSLKSPEERTVKDSLHRTYNIRWIYRIL